MLKNLTQPTEDSCMSTCLAMVLGISENESYSLYHHKLINYKIWFDDVLTENGIPFYYGSPKSSRISGDVLCFVTVASLNFQGGLHQVLVHCSDDKLTVYDPAKGIKNAKYYISPNQEISSKMEVHLRSWLLDIIIPLVKELD